MDAARSSPDQGCFFVTGTVCEVIVDLHVPDVDRVFHYTVPPELEGRVRLGHRVLVPFGHRPRVEGYIIGFGPAGVPRDRLKSILALLDEEPLLTPAQIEVARWMRDRYVCPLVQALQCFLPPGSRLRSGRTARALRQKVARLADPPAAGAAREALARRAPKQAAIIQVLLENEAPLPSAELLRRAQAPRSALHAVVQKGIVIEEEQTARRDPFHGRPAPHARRPHALTEDQQRALSRIREALRGGEPRRVLLQGVTGSGKTEVYLQAMAEALAQGRGAILLVPEIALTPQTVAYFRAHFRERIAVLHSRLSLGERYDQWWRIFEGELPVVIGARSAVFAPVKKLGLIILDEEHETSYKQEESPRYHARDVAWARAQREGAVLIMGSATPAVEVRWAAEAGEALWLSLPRRVHRRPLPRVETVDLRGELLAGNRSMFSRTLSEKLEAALDRGEQAVLFMNRRGMASFLLCRECGYVPRCTQCEVSLTLHDPGILRCHYCDAAHRLPEACPQCGGPYLRPFGGGTQRIEQEVKRLFPKARPVRMDVDTTARKGAHERIVEAFAAGRFNVLVGTQMVAKGLHFPGVTLVGVVSADTALNLPDFRAAERTFQLLSQVAGRAGRGERAGEVVIQTYAPDHYAIRAAAAHDYEGFYRAELAYRRRTGYPPFSTLVRLVWSGEGEEEVVRAAQAAGAAAAGDLRSLGVEALGPSPAPLSRLQGRYRWHLILKGEGEPAIEAARRIKEAHEATGSSGVRLTVDVDPVGML